MPDCHPDCGPRTDEGNLGNHAHDNVDGRCWHANEDVLDGVAPIPTTDYYDGRDGSIETDDDDEDHIADQDRLCVVCSGRDLLNDDNPPLCEACDDAARREEWAEYLEWQRGLGARN